MDELKRDLFGAAIVRDAGWCDPAVGVRPAGAGDFFATPVRQATFSDLVTGNYSDVRYDPLFGHPVTRK